MDSLANPLQPVVTFWLNAVRKGLEFKGRRFQQDANEGVKFFVGPYEWIYGAQTRRTDRHFRQTFDDNDDSEIPPPRFQMTVNKCAELVQIFGPVLYHRNPQRQVNPREYPLPDQDLVDSFGGDPSSQMFLQVLWQQGMQARAVDRARARLLEYYLNYTPNALDLKTESRWAIDEAIIKGRGCLWTEIWQPPAGGARMVGSFYDSVDNLVVDPDMPTLRACKWVARRRVMPVWECERKFGLPEGSLRGTGESTNRQVEVNGRPEGQYMRAVGMTSDLIEFWEVYSKLGIGGRMMGMAADIAREVDQYGDYCYLAVSQGVPYPLNVPDGVWDGSPQAAMQQIYQRLQWAVPYWADDAWPVTAIDFHSVPNDPWPMSHLAPGMGELKFLNWAFSYVAGKIRISSRDIVAILEEAPEEVREVFLRGADYEIARIKGSNGRTIDQMIQFLQHPGFNKDIWSVIEAVSELFEKRTGLTELMFGMQSRQDRSATESATKREQMNVRPDEMANCVEDAMSEIARKEALAVRWGLTGQDVQTIVGPVGAAMWDRLITPADVNEMLYSLEYRVEAGSVRKPNRDRDAQNAKDLVQTLLPFYQALAQGGFVQPFNEVVGRWAKTLDMKPEGLLLPQPAPPQAQPGQNPQQQPQQAA